MDNLVKKNSESKIRANNKYTNAHYKQLKIAVKPEAYEMIDTYCKDNDISKASFIVRACKYCIDNSIELREPDNTDSQ